jgi:hypothetical protein
MSKTAAGTEQAMIEAGKADEGEDSMSRKALDISKFLPGSGDPQPQ